MAELVAVMAETGHGKSHSIQYLDPKETLIVNADKKGLPFRNWKNKYNKENRNYYVTSNAESIIKIINGVSTNAEYSHIKHIVIDTMNGIMIDDEMKRMKEKGYDKWIDLAFSVYAIISAASVAREDLIIFCMFHMQDLIDELGNHFFRIQTSGRKLEKIKLETKFPIVLFGKCEYGDTNRYYFETQASYSTAKSPEGMFESKEIPNNLKIVADAIKRYNGIASVSKDEKAEKTNKETKNV